jgi:diguanylate cyclase (GGDEF)-like protein
MLDMGPRVVRARTIAAGAIGAGLLLTIGHLGWVAVLLFVAGFLNVVTVEPRIRRAKRPERVVACAYFAVIVLMGVSAALMGGGTSPVLGLLVIPVAMTAARFRSIVVWATAGVAALVALVATVLAGPLPAIHHPLTLAAVLVVLVGVTAVTTALMDAELEFRDASVLDPLTGLLNRNGLEARFAEIAGQARLLGRPVCLIICDLDNFKHINDAYGHERGDTVLREASYEMRKSLRHFELFYRLGGEEFLVLLPGIDLAHGITIAESLRLAVHTSVPGGVEMTASLGVSSATGEGIEFVSLYRAADDALYRAKASGRNRVVAPGVATPAAEAARAASEPRASPRAESRPADRRIAARSEV